MNEAVPVEGWVFASTLWFLTYETACRVEGLLFGGVLAGWWLCQECYGGYSVRETPGYIPNPEAKADSADGTALGRVWESRTPPDSFYMRGLT